MRHAWGRARGPGAAAAVALACLLLLWVPDLGRAQLSAPISDDDHISVDGNKFLQRKADLDREETSWCAGLASGQCGLGLAAACWLRGRRRMDPGCRPMAGMQLVGPGAPCRKPRAGLAVRLSDALGVQGGCQARTHA